MISLVRTPSSSMVLPEAGLVILANGWTWQAMSCSIKDSVRWDRAFAGHENRRETERGDHAAWPEKNRLHFEILDLRPDLGEWNAVCAQPITEYLHCFRSRERFLAVPIMLGTTADSRTRACLLSSRPHHGRWHVSLQGKLLRASVPSQIDTRWLRRHLRRCAY